MAKQFKVGDKVKIRKSSEYYSYGTSSNPADVEGTVNSVSAGAGHPIRVQWPGSQSNVYRLKDLKLSKVKEPKEKLLKEVTYTDLCDDTLEVDTSMSGQVYIAAGNIEGGAFGTDGPYVELEVSDVKKLRKQLKAWLDKNHPAA